MAAMRPRFAVRTAFVCITLLALAGCGHGGKPAATSATTTSGASWARPDAPPDPHTLLRAGATAVGTVPNSVLTYIASETEDEGTWKTRVVAPDGTEQQLKIGVDGVTVLVGPTPKNDSDADKAQHRSLVQAAHLDYQAAVNKMLAVVPNGSITELKLDNTDNTTVWDGHVWDTNLVGHKVTISAASGELVANKQE
ncbi:PepSY domain-containing protein [Mycobacterium celatum]|nr:metallopeptidase [Mycobacterium celatum]